jgi:hypothetical protein
VTAARTVSFTAARTLSVAAQEGIVTSVLAAHVPSVERYVTGACIGGDSFIGQWLYANRPEAEHIVVVPWNRSRVDVWWSGIEGPGVRVVIMPPGTTYADRNARLVEEADAVFAFPAYPEGDPRSLRSGTWQAARMARRAGKLGMWQCVTPPYQGLVERHAPELLGDRTAAHDPGCE